MEFKKMVEYIENNKKEYFDKYVHGDQMLKTFDLLIELIEQQQKDIEAFNRVREQYKESMKDNGKRAKAREEEIERLDFENYQKDELLYQEQQKFLEWNLKLNKALDRVKDLEQGIKVFIDKNFTGGSKSNRNDYSRMVSTSDIYELRKLIINSEKGD